MMNRAVRFSALLFFALAACGGKIEETPLGTGVSSSSGSGPGAPTGTSTSVPPSAPSPGKPTQPGDPPPPMKKVLTAQAMLGGLDHIFVYAADPVANSCVVVHLRSPGGPSDPYSNITTPKGWGVTDVSRWPDAKMCAPGKQPPPQEAANDGKGMISFDTPSGQVYPCTIDVHMAAVFAGVPTIEQIDGDKIAVKDCQ